jgi:hypothetical protein
MIAYLVFVGGFLALAVLLLVAIHLAVTAEDRRYALPMPAAPAETPPVAATAPEQRAA